jgi:GTPase SAR1 family protein
LSIQQAIKQHTTQLILAVIALIFATTTAWLTFQFDRLKTKVAVLSSRALDPFFRRPTLFDQYATNLILIGEGGSGKTAILHALSGANEANPDVSTATVSTYTLVNEISIVANKQETRRLVRIYVDDYVGQNWPQGALNERVKVRQSVIQSSTLVIVVDIFAPGTKTAPAERQGKFQTSRIGKHLESYNDQAIQTLKVLMGTRAQVVLFINKIDLIYPLTDEIELAIKEEFYPLIEKLEDLRGVSLHIILGSATTGLGIVGYDQGSRQRKSLYKFVVDHAERVDPSLLKKASYG